MNEGATNKFTVVLFTTDGFVWIYDHETQEEAVEGYSLLDRRNDKERVLRLAVRQGCFSIPTTETPQSSIHCEKSAPQSITVNRIACGAFLGRVPVLID